ncbi:uncharacterized protein LOC123866587 [Maniola jurtina]|uniref:uncharacterized protein LOC123866587 n=1 Tax=Maniola jurtina TaxID=191418 RepID=UPI001E68751E|nr:uncharacterized protein LOC123866587 [Maniola jurtina]XP_045764186.1 uncharacterized protein LOC123866587 [Maniola jurtina]XP_045764187.1 uncharacterized protein LOC123866587 [Maniola jurtina]XP_045764188.1 uncharacterized protein LOC123866587 [Maniola jurtina]XP_045764189.1 uncharacterized protein LOC123866587 [Maniola jurtina]
MGNSESVRATHFQRPDATSDTKEDDLPQEHHISISNKMVERLVEDASLTAGIDTSASNPKGDFREKMFIEKLKILDENHTNRFGLTVGELNAILKRVEKRTANMVDDEPVCAGIKRQIIECYDGASSPAAGIQCWDTIGAFTECVQAAGTKRLQARNERDALELARRTRHVAHAREHALKDLS